MIKEVLLKKEWNDLLNRVSNYDFYHTFDYHLIAAKKNEKPVLLVFEDNETIVVLPLVLRAIPNTSYFDFTSVYGYSGPLTNSPDDSYDFAQFQLKLSTYFKEKNVISVFSRLHPFIKQRNIINNLGEIVNLGKVVNINVSLPIEESRKGYGKSNKNQINKLRRQCSVHLAKTKEDILEFIDIYKENMLRLNAEDYYFFDKEYFFEFINIDTFKTDVLLIKDLETGVYIAGSMFVKTNNIVQYHLSGTRTEFLSRKPSKLFLDEMRLQATEEGFHHFNLGGGLGSKADTLFEFKASFSKDHRKFEIWKYIVNQEVYDNLSADKKDSGFFPKYREI